MALTIHAFPLSPRGFKVLWAANHMGADYEFRFLDLTKGAQTAPSFAALNLNRKMPVLEDGDFALWESNAILDYLAAKHSDAGLSPTAPRARADMLRWMFWESTTWDPACAILAFERAVKKLFGRGDPDPVEVEKGLAKFEFAAKILNEQLKGRRFVCGEALSLADLAIGAALTLTEPAQLPLGPYNEVRRWAAELEELPSWRATRAMQTPPVSA